MKRGYPVDANGVIDLTSDDEREERIKVRKVKSKKSRTVAVKESPDLVAKLRGAEAGLVTAKFGVTVAEKHVAEARFDIFHRFAAARGHVEPAKEWLKMLEDFAERNKAKTLELVDRMMDFPAFSRDWKRPDTSCCQACMTQTTRMLDPYVPPELATVVGGYVGDCDPKQLKAWKHVHKQIDPKPQVWWVYLERSGATVCLTRSVFDIYFLRGVPELSLHNMPSKLVTEPIVLCGPCASIRLALLHYWTADKHDTFHWTSYVRHGDAMLDIIEAWEAAVGLVPEDLEQFTNYGTSP